MNRREEQWHTEFIINPKKFSDEEAKEIAKRLEDRIRYMYDFDVDNNDEQ